MTTIELTKTLINCKSVTPDDDGCQPIIAERLQQLGFTIEKMRFGDVDNLWARYGNQSPLFVFAGHTDVVPPGPLEAWNTDPFDATIKDNLLYGRGATDMKSGLAAMIVATENFLQKHKDFAGSIAFLITSDEEGPSINGTAKVIEALQARNIAIDYCLVGEAASNKKLGDRVINGRRGSLHGTLNIQGKQGHVAYPEKVLNPIHLAMPLLHRLASEKWDDGNDYFPPTTFQITNIIAGTGAKNVVPGLLEVSFNFRFGTASTVESLQQRVLKMLQEYKLAYSLEWLVSGEPFSSAPGKLMEAVKGAIHEVVGTEPSTFTGGGTSDGRFIAKTGAEVIECGPCNTSAHQVDEFVDITDLQRLTDVYEGILVKLFPVIPAKAGIHLS